VNVEELGSNTNVQLHNEETTQVDHVDDNNDDPISKRTDGFEAIYPPPSQQSVLSALQNETLSNVQVQRRIDDDYDQHVIQSETKQRSIFVSDHTFKSSYRNRRYSRKQSLPRNRNSIQSVTQNKHDDSSTFIQSPPPIHETNLEIASDDRTAIESPLIASLHQHEHQTIDDEMVPVTTDQDQFSDCTNNIASTTDMLNEIVNVNQPNKALIDTIAEATTSKSVSEDKKAQDDRYGDSHVVRHTNDIDNEKHYVDEEAAKENVESMISTAEARDIVANAINNHKKDCINNTDTNICTPSKKRRQSAILDESTTIEITPNSRKKNKAIVPFQDRQCPPILHRLDTPPMILCQLSDPANSAGVLPIRSVRVNKQIWKHLKSHQMDGVKFMWQNCFSDFAYYKSGKTDHCGGCILAHNMGLVRAGAPFSLILTMLHCSL
jgi:hypothetical protein